MLDRLGAEALVELVGVPSGHFAEGLLIVADHAANHVPGDIDLGFAEGDAERLMETHIAYDIGVAAVARLMAAQEGAAAFLAKVSRLVCDLNRRADDPAVIPELSDGHAIPGNIGINRLKRLARFYHPYHQALEAVLAASAPRLSLVLHSFTPALMNAPSPPRPWDCGVMYDEDEALAHRAIAFLEAEGLCVGDQQPYSGKVYNAAIARHFEPYQRPYLYLEIRQDLIAEPRGQCEWAARLARLARLCADGALKPED